MNQKYKDKIAITTGDANGIGAEIVTKALNRLDIPDEKIVIISNSKIINKHNIKNHNYELIDIDYADIIRYGENTSASGDFSFNCLKKACEIRPKAIVTAPISKEAFHLARHNFSGQTEVLEHFLAHDNQKAEMLFTSNGFNVFLLTRHCALKDIKIDENMIIEKTIKLNNFFKNHYMLKEPKFAICSLNPHAGENGILGKEELDIMLPAIKKLKNLGINITNPMPSDTLFINAYKNNQQNKNAPFDCYIAIYHDQGLIPVKIIAGNKTVNTTIGLDIIRTSPAHGTAFDIAGKNIANPESMIEAIKYVL